MAIKNSQNGSGAPESQTEEDRLLNAQLVDRQEFVALEMSRYLLWSCVISIVMLLLAWLFSSDAVQLLFNAILLLFVGGISGFHAMLSRRGKARLGIHLMIAVTLLMIFMAPLFTPELMMAAGITYVAFTFFCNLLLGTRQGRWVTVLVLLCFIIDVVLIYIARLQRFSPLSATLGLVVRIVPAVFVALLSVVLAHYTVRQQEDYYRQSHRAHREIGKRVAIESQQRSRLQQANREIEKRAAIAQRQQEELQLMLARVREAANALGAAAAQILAATTQQTSGADNQSKAIVEASATIDEVRVIAEQNAQRAQGVADLAQQISKVSHAGQEAVSDTLDGMSQIQVRVEDIAQNILELSNQAQQIGEIISTVNDIAAQSNLLALNAAVEAARAGEQGRGFAVVASEVRRLAVQSRQATAQVRAILSAVQEGINTTVMATEEASKAVFQGEDLATQTRAVITQLANVIADSAMAAQQMVAGGQQQAAGMEQIADAIHSIQDITGQNLVGTRQTEQSAKDLNDLARSLKGIVGQYQR